MQGENTLYHDIYIDHHTLAFVSEAYASINYRQCKHTYEGDELERNFYLNQMRIGHELAWSPSSISFDLILRVDEYVTAANPDLEIITKIDKP